ncbi:MAG: ECF transporter S component [Clostridia bacterium]
MRDQAIKRLATAGVLAAAIILMTALVSVPLPGGHGYINLGDAGVLTAAFVLGGPWGALCAGIASAASDLILGWGIYAPATFVIKGGMALLAGILMMKKSGSMRLWVIYPTALFVPIGYFLFETVLYGAATAAPNMPLNLVQCIVGAAIANGVILVLNRSVSWIRLAETNVGKEQGTIAREPKGGPDVVLVGCETEITTLLKAANILSVQGFTGRIVQLNKGISIESLSSAERERLMPSSIPYVGITSCGKPAGTSAQDIAQAALEAIRE